MELTLRKCFERCFRQLPFHRCCSLRWGQALGLVAFGLGLLSSDGHGVRRVHSCEHSVRFDMHLNGFYVGLLV